jgi:hypothetical protein
VHRVKVAVEDRWKKKLEKLREATAAAQQQTARDVKQLTALHATHVGALERALKEEAERLGIAREQNKQLTIGRAEDAARVAAERERDAREKAQNLKDAELFRGEARRAEAEREEMARKFQGARGEAKRMEDEKRMAEAKLQVRAGAGGAGARERSEKKNAMSPGAPLAQVEQAVGAPLQSVLALRRCWRSARAREGSLLPFGRINDTFDGQL